MELSLTLVDDEVIREVNAEYRGVDAATDVLSFEMGEDEGEDASPQARRGCPVVEGRQGQEGRTAVQRRKSRLSALHRSFGALLRADLP